MASFPVLISLSRSRALLIGAGLFLIVAAAATVAAGSYIAQPTNHLVGPPPPDLGASEVHFPSASGSEIAGWFLRGEKGSGGVLLLHGVRADRWSMVDRARFFHKAGYSVLLIDLQAHGASPGRHITFGYLEARDVEAASAYLQRTLPGEPLAVVGPSLGGAAVVLSHHPVPFQAVILESVYPTINSAVRARLRERLGPLGSWLAPLLLVQLKPRLGIGPGDLRPVDHIGTLGAPLLLLGGSADRHPTEAETRLLYERAAGPKDLWIVPGAGHVDLHAHARSEYEQRVLAFLAMYLHRPG